jgi:magnesium-transporting ATPase (P-type)
MNYYIISDAFNKIKFSGIILLSWLFLLECINYFASHFYSNFIKNNPNLTKTKSYSYYWIQIFKSIYNFHNLGNIILLIVALIQYDNLRKFPNLVCYIMLLLYAIVMSHLEWNNDINIHRRNSQMVTISRNNTIHILPNSMIQINDIFILDQGDIIMVTEGIVIEGQFIVNNIAISGERTLSERRPSDIVVLGHEILSQGKFKIKVTKVEGDIIIESIKNNDFIPDLINRMTNVAMCVIMCISIIIYFYEEYNFDFARFILVIIRVFIGINFLFPSFKLSIGLTIFDMVYKKMAAKYGFYINRQWTQHNTIPPVICSDKTGTLTINEFDVSYQDTYFNKKFLTHFLAHIGGIEYNNMFWNDCMELVAVMKYLNNKYNVNFLNPHIFSDYVGNINNLQVTRHKYHSFSYKYNGTHSLIQINGKYFHIFGGNKDKLSHRLKYLPKKTSLLRGWLYGCIKLKSLNDFINSMNRFQDNNSEPINEFNIIGEFHFNNMYREYMKETTKDGINCLKQMGCPVVMITGDSVPTAEVIGTNLGLTPIIIHTYEFLQKSDEEKTNVIHNIISNRGAIFGNAKPQDKQTIVKLFQEYRDVIFLGDMMNDILAINMANYSVGQFDGCIDVKNTSHIIARVPTAAISRYLDHFMNWGTLGKIWFIKVYTAFNYITTSYWLIGIFNQNFQNITVLYIDPWSAALSTPMSSIVLTICIGCSMIKKHKIIAHNDILYYTPLKAFSLALLFGSILLLTNINLYNIIPFCIIITTIAALLIFSN